MYKMLQDYEVPVSQPKQSGSFKYLQDMLEAGENGKNKIYGSKKCSVICCSIKVMCSI